MMRNPFAINNGDLDGGDAGEERQRDESSGSVKMGRGDGRGDHRVGAWGKRWFDVTSSKVGTYATEGTSGAAAVASSSHAFYTSDGAHSCHIEGTCFSMSKFRLSVSTDEFPRYNLKILLSWPSQLFRVLIL